MPDLLFELFLLPGFTISHIKSRQMFTLLYMFDRRLFICLPLSLHTPLICADLW